MVVLKCMLTLYFAGSTNMCPSCTSCKKLGAKREGGMHLILDKLLIIGSTTVMCLSLGRSSVIVKKLVTRQKSAEALGRGSKT